MTRKWLAIAAKAAISVLLIWYLLDRIDVLKVVARARTLDMFEAMLCLLVLAVQTVLVALRWWFVAWITEVVLSFQAAFRILVIGMFFNQTLPSSVGGDAVRVWLVTREGVSLGKAVNVVLCDRVLALMVLVAIIGATLPAIHARVSDEATQTALAILVSVGAVGLTVFLMAGQRIVALLQRWRVTRSFGNLAADFHRLFTRPLAIGPLVLSVIIHLMTVLAVMFLAWGLDMQVSFLDGLMIVPTVLLLTTLPISVAGWGVREGAMVAGFGLVGVAPDGALALSVLFGLAMVVMALPGGAVWLVARPNEPPPVLRSVSK